MRARILSSGMAVAWRVPWRVTQVTSVPILRKRLTRASECWIGMYSLVECPTRTEDRLRRRSREVRCRATSGRLFLHRRSRRGTDSPERVDSRPIRPRNPRIRAACRSRATRYPLCRPGANFRRGPRELRGAAPLPVDRAYQSRHPSRAGIRRHARWGRPIRKADYREPSHRDIRLAPNLPGPKRMTPLLSRSPSDHMRRGSRQHLLRLRSRRT